MSNRTRRGVYFSSKLIVNGVLGWEQRLLAVLGDAPDEIRIPDQSVLCVLGDSPGTVRAHRTAAGAVLGDGPGTVRASSARMLVLVET